MFGLRYKLGKQPERAAADGGYRHIRVVDKIDAVKKVRSVLVECPLEYPGLTERERRSMYEGLAMIADAYRTADERLAREHRS